MHERLFENVKIYVRGSQEPMFRWNWTEENALYSCYVRLDSSYCA